VNLSGLSGLSATWPGYQEAETTFQGNEAAKLKNQQTLIDRAGAEAYGNTLRYFGGQQPQTAVPTGPSAPPPQMAPPQGGPSPQPPAPGQPSVPMQQPGQGASAAPPQGAPPAAPPAPMAGVPSPQGQPGSGPLDWRTIAAHVAHANPGAPPAVIAAAVDRFTPLMNAQSLQDWRVQSLKVQNRNADIREDTADETAEARKERLRLQAEAERGRNKRADMVDERSRYGINTRDERAATNEEGRNKHVRRLVELKRRYDPENLFRINHNIPTAG